MPSASSDRIATLVAALESRGIPYYCVPNAGNLLFSSLRFGQIAGMPVFTRRLPVADSVYEVLKRVMDLLGALGILIITAPILLVSMLLIRLTSPGPVFFRQTRVGLNGKPLNIFKLRTMSVDAPRYALHPSSSNDARVTAVGAWLRRCSIDELPQLFNVLRGEMSLVGPRPEMPFVVAKYNDIHKLRLSVKPGVTGLWQISADRAFSIHENIQYDLYYVDHRSAALDVAILIATPFVLLAKNRAM
jgi:exopolysaccharide biosynthesis polyprenyl glycosylphosphotransferase